MNSPQHPRHSDALPISAFTPSEVASDLSWAPDMAAFDEPPLTAKAYVQAYLADPTTWWWSTNDYSSSEADVVLKRVLAIAAEAQLPDHEEALGQVGVGPLENMMSDTLLDLLGAWMPFTPAMRYALSSVRMEFESPALQRRLSAMIAGSLRNSR
ncbi:hypothetical protein G6N74_20855 [Mesorhizobium sp. CGMCC 1.15528]|uniref:Uncharacterized protein n=2 Tax=Mesorhizobium TaxID=68287 RepID=A0A7C9V8N7_9HYPH|nr:hypothetical protein [Mesorhizobium zhangyense]NGN43525.1 hypothetical protein [Mesorhizobium zhangyense]